MTTHQHFLAIMPIASVSEAIPFVIGAVSSLGITSSPRSSQ